MDATVIDFWRWAFSDLQADDLRGVFAEWLVAKLLGLAPPTRDSWGDWDLQTPEGVKIEVKTSAFLQAWEQSKLSAISFSGLNGRSSSLTADSTALPTYKSDMYVFCVHKEEDRQRWNALDLDQWRFYVLRREDLELYGYRRISIGPLRRITPELDAGELRERWRCSPRSC